jgi:hypothetical protein
MKNQNQPRNDRKLPLRKEVVRTLNQVDLANVVGGDITSTTHVSRIIC